MSDAESENAYQIEEIDLPEEQPGANGPVEDVADRLDLRMDSLPPNSLAALNPAGMANTGPKGVLADFEVAKRTQHGINLRKKDALARQIKEMTLGVEQFHLPDLPVEKKKEKAKVDCDEEDDEEEDEIFQQYKRERIQHILDEMPSFGRYEKVSLAELAAEVKRKDAYMTYSVIHLYQNYIEACARLHGVFEALAPQFPHVHFMRIVATDAIKNFHDVGLPTLLIYRGEVMKEKLIRVADSLTKDFTDRDVVKLLLSLKVMQRPTLDIRPPDD